MVRIFISYRRADSAAESGRIYDRLAPVFGDENVFKDVDDIPAGEDFRAVLEREVSRCDVLLVVLGTQWATITDSDGRRRLHDPNDFVNIEVEAGLSRSDVLVIPLLVGSAIMPSPEQLPENLRALCYRNAMPVRHDPDFSRDVQRLIERIRVYSEKKSAPASVTNRPRLPIYLGALAAALALIALAFVISRPDAATQIIATDTPAVSSPVPTEVATQPPTTIPVPTTPAPSATPMPTPAPLLIAQAVATARENARVWSGPDVMGSEEITSLPAGTQVVILDGPMRGNVRLDANIQGDWYEVRRLDETIALGWIWAERLTLTDEVRRAEIPARQVHFSRSLYDTSPRLYGPDVMRAQGRLRALGYSLAVIDGYYGPLTANTVRQFQQRNALTADSAIDGITWNRLFSPGAVPAG